MPRSDPAVEVLPEHASEEERALVFAKALARRAVLAWEGIGDADGNPIAPHSAVNCGRNLIRLHRLPEWST